MFNFREQDTEKIWSVVNEHSLFLLLTTYGFDRTADNFSLIAEAVHLQPEVQEGQGLKDLDESNHTYRVTGMRGQKAALTLDAIAFSAWVSTQWIQEIIKFYSVALLEISD